MQPGFEENLHADNIIVYSLKVDVRSQERTLCRRKGKRRVFNSLIVKFENYKILSFDPSVLPLDI